MASRLVMMGIILCIGLAVILLGTQLFLQIYTCDKFDVGYERTCKTERQQIALFSQWGFWFFMFIEMCIFLLAGIVYISERG